MMNAIRKRMRGERGDSEVVTTILMFPLAFWLIFSLIDVSLYFQARTSVQNITRDAARQVAIWGGNTSPLHPAAIDASFMGLLYDSSKGKCVPGNCTAPPTITCTPSVVTTGAGTDVSCTTTYHYSAVNKGNPITGFTDFMNSDIVITEHARSETGFR